MFVDDATKDIMSKERLHRTRATVLQSSGKVRRQLSVLAFVTCLIPRLCSSLVVQLAGTSAAFRTALFSAFVACLVPRYRGRRLCSSLAVH